MGYLDNEIDKLKHDILVLGRDTPALRKRLAELITDSCTSFREEMAILARFDEAMREHPRTEQAFLNDEFRCKRCSRLLEPGWSVRVCRACEAEENSEIRDDLYRNL